MSRFGDLELITKYKLFGIAYIYIHAINVQNQKQPTKKKEKHTNNERWKQ